MTPSPHINHSHKNNNLDLGSRRRELELHPIAFDLCMPDEAEWDEAVYEHYCECFTETFVAEVRAYDTKAAANEAFANLPHHRKTKLREYRNVRLGRRTSKWSKRPAQLSVYDTSGSRVPALTEDWRHKVRGLMLCARLNLPAGASGTPVHTVLVMKNESKLAMPAHWWGAGTSVRLDSDAAAVYDSAVYGMLFHINDMQACSLFPEY